MTTSPGKQGAMMNRILTMVFMMLLFVSSFSSEIWAQQKKMPKLPQIPGKEEVELGQKLEREGKTDEAKEIYRKAYEQYGNRQRVLALHASPRPSQGLRCPGDADTQAYQGATHGFHHAALSCPQLFRTWRNTKRLRPDR